MQFSPSDRVSLINHQSSASAVDALISFVRTSLPQLNPGYRKRRHTLDLLNIWPAHEYVVGERYRVRKVQMPERSKGVDT
jgi:hypothetical protein